MRPYLLLIAICTSAISFAQGGFWGRTTGVLPFVEYGTGDDRLGGAKMTYLDTNVLVQVVDSSGSDYKLQLSQRHIGWLSKQFFRRDDSIRRNGYFLTTSWRVWGDDTADYVSIGLPARLPYRSRQEINPSRIVIDVFGATSNTNWITQLKTVKSVESVWYEQVEEDLFRVFIQLKGAQHWGHSIYYRNNALQVRIKRAPEKLKLKGLRIAIDAGHGGSNTGAKGKTGILEKDYTLKIAKELEDYLTRKGAITYMTRNTDTALDMNQRVLMVKESNPDLLISIHLNSAGNANAKGVSTYYRHIGFRPLTQTILDRMLELGLNNFGNIGAFNFTLSGPTDYPNCLVEVAFISNEEDEQRIIDPKFQKEVAKKITKGIEDWLKEMD